MLAASHVQEEGVAVTSNALHPGVIATDLTRFAMASFYLSI
jgi:hypothetical protein